MNEAFLDNKYSKWYFNIVSKAKNSQRIGYLEKHHIIPSAINQDLGSENVVKLTAREHYICHALLVKMTQGHIKDQLVQYFNDMPGKNSIEYQVTKILLEHSDQFPVNKKSISEYSSVQLAKLNHALVAYTNKTLR